MENEFKRLKITKLIDPEEDAHGVKKYPHHLDQTPNNNASFKQESICKALYGKSKATSSSKIYSNFRSLIQKSKK